MKIIIATDSFKDCCTSLEAATAIEAGIRGVVPDAEIIKIAIADGGEGTVDAIVSSCGGDFVFTDVHDPLMNTIHAKYAILNKSTAIIEMAAASGLPLVPIHKRNPLNTTTYGTGELILDALNKGCRKLLIGVGGSATNDGGMGMAQALGVTFIDNSGKPLSPFASDLSKLYKIDISSIDMRISECEITVLCDVSNTLCGPTGASHIFGPQKGATPEDILILDKNLNLFAECIKKTTGKDILNISGGGAAGGLAAGLIAFCNATLKPGIDTILDLSDFDNHARGTDLIITGEGRVDNQSAFGKVISGIAKRSRMCDVPVAVLAGSIGTDTDKLYEIGVSSIMSICSGPMTLEESISNFGELAADAASRMIRFIQVGKKIGQIDR